MVMDHEPDFSDRRVAKMPTFLDEHGVLTCPDCGCQDFKITHTRAWNDGKKSRRRECTHCGKSVTTYEIIQNS